MCIAIPRRVLEVDTFTAVVDQDGSRHTVSLRLLSEDVAVGDYLVLQAGTYAVACLDAASALEAIALFNEALGVTPVAALSLPGESRP